MASGLEERIGRIRQRISEACARAGRPEDSVLLVAVSKTFPAEAVVEAARLGLATFGENRVQEAVAKIPTAATLIAAASLRSRASAFTGSKTSSGPAETSSPPISWHLIGHLQSNKAKAAAGLFELIHSVDGVTLARKLDAAAGAISIRQRVLLQVNVAGEAQKSGVEPSALEVLVETVTQCPHLELRGLMTLPPYDPDPELSRPHFQKLGELGDRVRSWIGPTYAGELSMGMSEDFEVAIEEGATIIRVGRALFGERGNPAAAESMAR